MPNLTPTQNRAVLTVPVTDGEFALGVQRLAEETHTVSSKLSTQIREHLKAMSYRLLELVPLKFDRHLELRNASKADSRIACRAHAAHMPCR